MEQDVNACVREGCYWKSPVVNGEDEIGPRSRVNETCYPSVANIRRNVCDWPNKLPQATPS